jgi:hypothetical protein
MKTLEFFNNYDEIFKLKLFWTQLLWIKYWNYFLLKDVIVLGSAIFIF